ncbi:hypothetical protein JCM33374_g149 [Metschnikowia sp. JCM 33374]|nr:hypothetical protein JCM33374_g149 [Metschnikowia sp. JCM 33374]
MYLSPEEDEKKKFKSSIKHRLWTGKSVFDQLPLKVFSLINDDTSEFKEIVVRCSETFARNLNQTLVQKSIMDFAPFGSTIATAFVKARLPSSKSQTQSSFQGYKASQIRCCGGKYAFHRIKALKLISVPRNQWFRTYSSSGSKCWLGFMNSSVQDTIVFMDTSDSEQL